VVALAKYGIRTHSVNPGVTRTPLWDPWGVDDQGWKAMAKSNPLGRNCTPRDVAKVICYLDSDEAEYLNGEEIYVNGGNHLKSLSLNSPWYDSYISLVPIGNLPYFQK